MKLKPCIVGIDFGTTSLSAVVINMDNICIEKVFCYDTNAYMIDQEILKREQSIEILSQLFYNLLDEIDRLPGISIRAYGFTGQMHGIVGLNKDLLPVTNLVTWEDKSGDTILPEGVKLLNKIKSLSGNDTLSNGYGIVTLYKWLNIEKRKDIHCFCTIADYFASLMTGKVSMSPSMAQSVGLFDIHTNQWDENSIQRLELNIELFPKIVEESTIIGYGSRNGTSIPVVVAMGDNQASFMGSVIDKNESILLNVGTGTQISALIGKDEKSIFDKYIDNIETQLRPYNADTYLMSTSLVNGGSVYKALFNFFKESAETLFELDYIDDNRLWTNMEKAASQNKEITKLPEVEPLFAGQRKDPDKKGKITDLTLTNFTPGSLIAGFLVGLARYYKTGVFPELSERVKYVCGSGNGLKKNRELVEVIEKVFEKSIHLTIYNEEAAVGAVLSAAHAMKIINNEKESKTFLTNLSTPNK